MQTPSSESTSQPLVSIAINNYNYGHFLPQAIESSLNQTYPHVEVIVVDDGSTDNSREIIRNYSDRVVPVFKENGGQASAINAGFAASHGDIVIFLDSDDFLYPRALEQIASVFREGVSKVHCRMEVVGPEGEPLGQCFPLRGAKLSSGGVVKQLLSRGTYSFPRQSGNAFSRRSLLSMLPVPPESNDGLTAEAYLALLAPFYGEIAAVEEPLAAYRQHGSSMTSSPDCFFAFMRHADACVRLVIDTARDFGMEIPPDVCSRNVAYLKTKLLAGKLEHQGTATGNDRPLKVAWMGIGAIWKWWPEFSLLQKTVRSVWFLVIALAPHAVVQWVCKWTSRPEDRPWFLRFMLRRVL